MSMYLIIDKKKIQIYIRYDGGQSVDHHHHHRPLAYGRTYHTEIIIIIYDDQSAGPAVHIVL